MIRWPGWRHLPREARDTLFLLGVIAWTLAPHVTHLPLWCSLLTAVVLVWRGVLALRAAPLPGRWTLAAVLLLAIGLTWSTHGRLLGQEAGVTLLVVLVALKTLELRARRDALVIFFLGFFIVLTHFLHSQSLAVAAAMLVSVWGLLTALVLAHMPVGQPGLWQAGRLAARFALLGAPVMALLFVLFPRIGPLWGTPTDRFGITGLSGEMRMGTIAELVTDDSIALRMRILDGPLPPPEALYFRGPVLSAFDGIVWRVGTPRFPPPPLNLRPRGTPVTYEMTLEPRQLSMIPALEATPTLPALAGLRVQQRADLHWSTYRPITERLSFTAQAWPRFEHGPTEPVLGLQDELELPPGRNPRTLAWAAALRRDPRYAEADGATLAAALMQHIRTGGYSYTLAPGVYDEEERGTAIDEFWLDRKLGFCEHFAAAFVVVMRALDVPARVVTGYQGAERNDIDGTLVVRQSFAHAWAEYWQPSTGWVRADPTAAIAPERIQRSLPLSAPRGFVAETLGGVAPNLLFNARALWDAINHGWNQWVLNYTRQQQVDLLSRLGLRGASWQDAGIALAGTLSVLALLAAAWAWWDQRRMNPWLRAYDRVRRAAAERGYRTGAHQPPRALAAELQATAGPAAAPVVAALQALDALRYARSAPTGPGARRAAKQLVTQALRALRTLPRADLSHDTLALPPTR